MVMQEAKEKKVDGFAAAIKEEVNANEMVLVKSVERMLTTWTTVTNLQRRTHLICPGCLATTDNSPSRQGCKRLDQCLESCYNEATSKGMTVNPHFSTCLTGERLGPLKLCFSAGFNLK